MFDPCVTVVPKDDRSVISPARRGASKDAGWAMHWDQAAFYKLDWPQEQDKCQTKVLKTLIVWNSHHSPRPQRWRSIGWRKGTAPRHSWISSEPRRKHAAGLEGNGQYSYCLCLKPRWWPSRQGPGLRTSAGWSWTDWACQSKITAAGSGSDWGGTDVRCRQVSNTFPHSRGDVHYSFLVNSKCYSHTGWLSC